MIGGNVVFAMRYASDVGYVWAHIAKTRDLVARQLHGHVKKIFIGYPVIGAKPAYQPTYAKPIELDLYDKTIEGRRKIERFICDYNIKIVVYMSATPALVPLRLLRKLGVKTINTEEDSFDWRKRDGYAKQLAKFLVRRCLKLGLHDVYVPISHSQGMFLRERAFIPPSRINIIPNGVDTAIFNPGDRQAVRRDLGIGCSKFCMISICQARREKRVDIILLALSRFLKSQPNADLVYVVVGGGPMEGEWRRCAASLNIDQYVRFEGPQASTVAYYQAADIFVHAAERESFGLVLAEAMACGIPVVAAAAAGPSDLIRDGLSGRLVGINDIDAFFGAIESYYLNQDLIRKHGEEARAFIIENYSIDHQISAMSDLIRQKLDL